MNYSVEGTTKAGLKTKTADPSNGKIIAFTEGSFFVCLLSRNRYEYPIPEQARNHIKKLADGRGYTIEPGDNGDLIARKG